MSQLSDDPSKVLSVICFEKVPRRPANFPNLSSGRPVLHSGVPNGSSKGEAKICAFRFDAYSIRCVGIQLLTTGRKGKQAAVLEVPTDPFEV